MVEEAGVLLHLQATVLETIARGGSLQRALDQLCGLVEEVVDDSVCSTMLFDPAAGVLNVFSAPNASTEMVSQLNGLVPSDTAGSCGTAVYQRMPVFVSDTATDYRWAPFRGTARILNIAACWSVPILSRNNDVLGSFAIARQKIGAPRPFVRKILLTASHIAGISIEKHLSAVAFQASEQKYRDLYNRAPDMFVSVDARTNAITDCNLAFVETLGRTKDELLDQSFLSYWDPSCAERVAQFFCTCADGKQMCSEDLWLTSSDGARIDVTLKISVAYDENQEPISSLWILRDVREYKRATQDILHRAEYQALLVDISSQLIRARHADVTQQFDSCMKRVGTAYALDGISLWWFSKDGTGLRQINSWAGGEDRGLPGYQPRGDSRWLIDRIKEGRPLVVDNIESMPAEAAVEQEDLRRYGAKSFLMIPMLIDGNPKGVVFYTMLTKEYTWSAETVSELNLVTENLAGAIARSEAMSRINQLKDRLQKENVYLREEIRVAHGFDEIIGENTGLVRSLQLVEKVAPTGASVLILGQTGTGKELIARALHKLSDRRDKPMVSVNCPALPATLIESELFGHEKGAFTGAHAQRKGRFELADGGTIFLDELGDLPLELQSKLLRVLQSGEFERLGGTKTLKVDVRLVAATNRDLKQAVEDGAFRADLYYRINSFPIQLPALCERRGDISQLAEHFLRKHAEHLGKKITRISSGMMQEMLQYSWPGNIRELESVIARSLISAIDDSPLKLSSPLSSLDDDTIFAPAMRTGTSTDLSTVERSHIISVLDQTEWMIAGSSGAASALGLPPSTLRSKMKRLGIDRQSV